VDFGSLTRGLVAYLQSKPNFELLLNHPVTSFKQNDNGRWRVSTRNGNTGESRKLRADFVFIGAGGGALPLLQKTGIPESKGFRRLSGQWPVACVP